MRTTIGIGVMLMACAAVLIIGALQRKAAFLLRFLVRAVVGAVGICLANGWLAAAGYGISVGLNVWNLLVVGSLGIGGFGMLYAILLYMNL